MMHDFLSANRDELVQRCRAKVALRPGPEARSTVYEHGVRKFLEQLIRTLQVEQTSEPLRSQKISGPSGGGAPVISEIGETAARHGIELLQRGFTVDEVVHDYGDMCQSITDLAVERGVSLQTGEFRTLNRCLDNAIAGAVTEFSYQRDAMVADNAAQTLNERLGFLAHELRNLVATATLAVTALKTGNVGVAGATGAVLDRSLIGLRNLIDRSLAEVRVTAGLPAQHRLISLADFIHDVRMSAGFEAQARECEFTVSAVDPSLALAVDRDLLLSAVGNLLQNAFKYTSCRREVALSAYAVADRIHIDVEDHCGGLPAGAAENMFKPFTQFNADKSGLGLGLSIARRSVEANYGVLSVRDVPGSGCVFSIDLERHAMPIGAGTQLHSAPSNSL